MIKSIAIFKCICLTFLHLFCIFFVSRVTRSVSGPSGYVVPHSPTHTGVSLKTLSVHLGEDITFFGLYLIFCPLVSSSSYLIDLKVYVWFHLLHFRKKHLKAFLRRLCPSASSPLKQQALLLLRERYRYKLTDLRDCQVLTQLCIRSLWRSRCCFENHVDLSSMHPFNFLPPLSLMPNHFLPVSDKHLNSPNSITLKSNIKVMRMKGMIATSISSWLLDKFSLQVPSLGNV